MARTAGLITIPLVIAALAIAPVSAEELLRHSGTIVALGPDRQSLTLEEITAWTGPQTGRVSRTIALTPDSRIRLVERSATWSGSPTSGFKESPLPRMELKPGDFVTVSTNRRGDRLVAVSVEVVRPSPTP